MSVGGRGGQKCWNGSFDFIDVQGVVFLVSQKVTQEFLISLGERPRERPTLVPNSRKYLVGHAQDNSPSRQRRRALLIPKTGAAPENT